MKLKLTLLFLLILYVCAVSAQTKYSTKSGTITFEASVPSFEEVKATNEQVSAVLNLDNGTFAALALINGFRFKVALMEEHFNENYMESATFPKAIFKGTLDGFSPSSLTGNASSFILKGELTIHGNTQPLECLAQVSKTTDGVRMETSFVLNPKEFDIEIPQIVSSKIAKEVLVSVSLLLKS
ncbi:MAG: YceI family protein [Flavobacteriaceae bacterium]